MASKFDRESFVFNPFLFRALRFAGYKQYTFWVHNYLGKGVRKVIPSCAVWKIRNNYKSEDDNYVPFMESKEDENRLLSND